ncbi:MAG: tyrosine-type recombinase/integrase [Desulfobaccales bacterium]
MRTLNRIKTAYPGVFYYNVISPATGKPERLYYIRYRRDGKEVEEPCGRQYQDDMTPARASRIRAEKIDGKAPSRREKREAERSIKWTLGRLWSEYIGPKPDTKGFRTDRYRYQKFLQGTFGAKEPKDLSQIMVHRLRISLAKTLSAKTVKNVLELLERIVNFGVKKGLCAGLGFKPEHPRVNNQRTEDLSPEQIADLLTAIDEDHDIQAGDLMKLALVSGMRRGEMFKLQWQHIDFDKGFIHIIGPKGGKDQTIPLNPAAREILENHPKDNNSAFVFPGRGGGQRVEIRRPIDRIRKRAGLPKDFRPLHGLRHTFASMLASSGEVDLYTLMKLLTHKSPAMTMRYAHLRDDTLRRASGLAGDLLTQVINGNGKVAHLKSKN